MIERKLILYIAASLDGYIADRNGRIDFLYESPQPEPDLDYEEFYSTVDTIIMGNRTYLQVTGELSPDQWVYEGKKCYVYSHKPIDRNEHAEFVNCPPKELLARIREEKGLDIWLVGGGNVIHAFMEENLIDRYYIYIMPCVLGSGISLFPPEFPKADLKLISTRTIGEMVKLIYERK